VAHIERTAHREGCLITSVDPLTACDFLVVDVRPRACVTPSDTTRSHMRSAGHVIARSRSKYRHRTQLKDIEVVSRAPLASV
jgi:hypothetical protein